MATDAKSVKAVEEHYQAVEEHYQQVQRETVIERNVYQSAEFPEDPRQLRMWAIQLSYSGAFHRVDESLAAAEQIVEYITNGTVPAVPPKAT